LLLTGDRAIDLRTGGSRPFRIRGLGGSLGVNGSAVALRADGTFAVVGGPGLGQRIPNRVTTGVVPPEAATTPQTVVPGTRNSFQVLGWRDADHLLVARGHPAPVDSPSIDAVDVRTGESETLVEFSPYGGGWMFASEHLDAPVIAAVEPP